MGPGLGPTKAVFCVVLPSFKYDEKLSLLIEKDALYFECEKNIFDALHAPAADFDGSNAGHRRVRPLGEHYLHRGIRIKRNIERTPFKFNWTVRSRARVRSYELRVCSRRHTGAENNPRTLYRCGGLVDVMAGDHTLLGMYKRLSAGYTTSGTSYHGHSLNHQRGFQNSKPLMAFENYACGMLVSFVVAQPAPVMSDFEHADLIDEL